MHWLTIIIALVLSGCSAITHKVPSPGYVYDWAGYRCIGIRCDDELQPISRPTSIRGALTWVSYRQHYLDCNEVAASLSMYPYVDTTWSASMREKRARAIRIASNMAIGLHDAANHPILRTKVRAACVDELWVYADLMQRCQQTFNASADAARQIALRINVAPIQSDELIAAIISLPSPQHNFDRSVKVNNCTVTIE